MNKVKAEILNPDEIDIESYPDGIIVGWYFEDQGKSYVLPTGNPIIVDNMYAADYDGSKEVHIDWPSIIEVNPNRVWAYVDTSKRKSVEDEHKYLFFRDVDHRGNLEDGKTHHAAGIVIERVDTNSKSGKDLLVRYVDPFGVYVETCWRGDSEVELFEGTATDWNDDKATFEAISDTQNREVIGDEAYVLAMIKSKDKSKLIRFRNDLLNTYKLILRLLRNKGIMIRGDNYYEYDRSSTGWNNISLIESLLLYELDSSIRVYDREGNLNYLQNIGSACNGDLLLDS